MSNAVGSIDSRGYAGEDIDSGKLFEVPRVEIAIDKSDPDVVKISFSGSYELDRGNAQQIEFYNALRAGDETTVMLTVHVAGAKKTHRLDSEGFVDAVVETKTLVVRELHCERDES